MCPSPEHNTDSDGEPQGKQTSTITVAYIERVYYVLLKDRQTVVHAYFNWIIRSINYIHHINELRFNSQLNKYIFIGITRESLPF